MGSINDERVMINLPCHRNVMIGRFVTQIIHSDKYEMRVDILPSGEYCGKCPWMSEKGYPGFVQRTFTICVLMPHSRELHEEVMLRGMIELKTDEENLKTKRHPMCIKYEKERPVCLL